MFREDFYRWLRDDFIVNRTALNSGGSFLAKYFEKHSYMVPKYDDLCNLLEGFKAGKLSKDDLYHVVHDIYKRGKLQIFEKVNSDTDKKEEGVVKSVDPFKAVDEADISDAQLIDLTGKILSAMLDEKVKAYLYDVGFPVPRMVDVGKKSNDDLNSYIKEIAIPRKKEAILDLIDEFLMHNNISLKFNDLGKIVSEKKENDEDKASLKSAEFKEEAKRVYGIIRNSKRTDIILPLYQSGLCGIYILGRDVINSEELINKGAERLKNNQIFKSNMKVASNRERIIEDYYNKTSYLCFVYSASFWDTDTVIEKREKGDLWPQSNLQAELDITVCYSIKDAIATYELNSYCGDMAYESFNGQFIPELGEKYKQYFECE